MTPPNDGNELRIVVAMLDRFEVLWYPVPAAVLDAGAPM